MIQNQRNNICYYCGKSAATDEHVPPECFFPKGYRKHLIKVRSCSVHNNLYSMDDEYVRNILSMDIKGNQISRDMYFKKSKKSFRRTPGLAITINETMKPVKLENGIVTGVFKLDRKRFDRVMDKIARGLYFYDFKCIWETKLNIYSPIILKRNNLISPYEKLFKKVYKAFVWGKSRGENIDVFTYKWGKDTSDNIMLRLRLYNNILVYIFQHYSD